MSETPPPPGAQPGMPHQHPNAEAMEKAAALPGEVKGRSLWEDARRRLFSNKAAVASMIILAILVLAALIGPEVTPHDFRAISYGNNDLPPSWSHWMGTDNIGRDVLARTLIGARVSLAVGLIATFVSLVIGVIWGATAGFFGGTVDNVMMRIVDVLYSLPFVFFVIILMVVFGTSLWIMFVAIGAIEWLTMARIVRGQTLSLKEKEFVEAARAIGVKPLTIVARHIVPNLIGPVIIYVTLTIPYAILAESFLSFLGLGVQEPLTSWGVLISEGANGMQTAPWALLFPAGMMALTLFCFNFIGDGLRDALDPKDR
ncbi:peptide ABC transporter permease [Aquisalinus flavus]|uniref:Oligopeptide transport system permease protein OppC n=2 Tax=Aquisalinus flavus TaxID=1526572 RepID=A0A8J2Y898_9PROT|nr:ABC transporter permease subunit [Aquisalinus flavus]GGD16897.1 peptide ABC transporter permease [Aquisalinus flavus]